jgi:uncharacterized protein YyaL (SSP411 family)
VRKIELYDGATPSSNAVMSHNLLILGICMGSNEMLEQAVYMIKQMSASAIRYTTSFGYWSLLLQRYTAEQKLVICTGPNADLLSIGIRKQFIPQGFVITAKKEIEGLEVLESKVSENSNSVYVCTQYACLPPVDNEESALILIKNYK